MTSDQALEPAAPSPAAVLPQAALAALTTAIKRSISAVRAETLALRNGENRSLKTFEHRKSQALLDLARARASLPPVLHDQEVTDLLQELKHDLSENMELLSHHMKAMKEITELLAKSMLEADSDGTYSRLSPGVAHD